MDATPKTTAENKAGVPSVDASPGSTPGLADERKLQTPFAFSLFNELKEGKWP
jgi:hypothetical protein